MRASWKVVSSSGLSGPWLIQLAVSDGKGGHRYSPPKKGHTRFQTKKEAENFKRTLPTPFYSHGVVVDGITTSAVAF